MRYKCLKKSTFVVFYNILTVMYSLLRMNSRLQLTFENDIIHSLPNKTEGNRNILPVPISLHNNTCTYPKVKPKWLSSYTSINPFTRCIQTLFSRASHPTANAVLSTLRFNFLASSGIDILFTSLRTCHTLPALTPTILLSIRLTFKYLYSIDNNPTNIP